MSSAIEKIKIKNIQSDEYQPVFFRLSSEKDKESLNKLMDIYPELFIHDELFGQVRELIKSRNPTIKFTSKQLDDEALKFHGAGSAEEYGVWVFYPWSRRLVHILDEKEFIELRTNRNHYK